MTAKKPATTTKKPAAKNAAGSARVEPVKKKVGAPSIYTPELAAAVCELIAEGKTLREIAATDGMPAMSTIMSWLDGRQPAFTEQYARAREAQADKMAEDILTIADEECTMVRSDKHGSKDEDGAGNTEVLFDATAVARNRLRVDARKWLASKMAPKKYGDKVENVHTGANGGPIETSLKVTFVAPSHG